jgi:hypothetical protein
MEEAAVSPDLRPDRVVEIRRRVESDTAARYGVEVLCGPDAVTIDGVAAATWAYDIVDDGRPIGTVHQLVARIPGAWRMSSACGRTPKPATSLDGAIEAVVYQARRP